MYVTADKRIEEDNYWQLNRLTFKLCGLPLFTCGGGLRA